MNFKLLFVRETLSVVQGITAQISSAIDNHIGSETVFFLCVLDPNSPRFLLSYPLNYDNKY